jgi:hypothetical protein
MTYADEMRNQANEAEAELVFRFGYRRTLEMLDHPAEVRQQGPDDLAHYLLTVVCNRRAEASAAEAAATPRRSGLEGDTQCQMKPQNGLR